MKFIIENIKWQSRPGQRAYVTFWVRFLFPSLPGYLSISGWRYYPDTGTMATPSVPKGGGKFMDLLHMSAEVYNAIGKEAYRLIGGLQDAITVAAEGVQHSGEAAAEND